MCCLAPTNPVWVTAKLCRLSRAPLSARNSGAHLSFISSHVRAPGTATSASATAASTARAPKRVVDLAEEGGGASGVFGGSVILPPAMTGPIHT